MIIPTSEEGLVVSLNKDNTNVLLCDYDIDGDELKSAHRDWLEQQVIEPYGLSKSSSMLGMMSITIEGRTSRTGSDRYNLALSQKRAVRVQAYLKNKVNSQIILSPRSRGESLSSYADNTEYAIDRAVRVQLGSVVRITPETTTRPATKLFKLRVISGEALSGTIGVGKIGLGATFEELFIQIWNVSESTTAFYRYTNNGKSGGFGLGLPISPEKINPGPGAWNEFRAPACMTVDGFGGPARLTGSTGIYLGLSLCSTDRDFHFGGFQKGKWWSAPSFKFEIESLEMNGSSAPSVGLGFFEAGPVGKLSYAKGSLRTGYNGD